MCKQPQWRFNVLLSQASIVGCLWDVKLCASVHCVIKTFTQKQKQRQLSTNLWKKQENLILLARAVVGIFISVWTLLIATATSEADSLRHKTAERLCRGGIITEMMVNRYSFQSCFQLPAFLPERAQRFPGRAGPELKEYSVSRHKNKVVLTSPMTWPQSRHSQKRKMQIHSFSKRTLACEMSQKTLQFLNILKVSQTNKNNHPRSQWSVWYIKPPGKVSWKSTTSLSGRNILFI